MAGEPCWAPHPFAASDFKGAAQSELYKYQQNGAQGQLVVNIREMQNSTIPNRPLGNSTCLNYCYYGKDIEIANINTTEGCRCCSFLPANILLAAKYYPSQHKNNTHGGQYTARSVPCKQGQSWRRRKNS